MSTCKFIGLIADWLIRFQIWVSTYCASITPALATLLATLQRHQLISGLPLAHHVDNLETHLGAYDFEDARGVIDEMKQDGNLSLPE